MSIKDTDHVALYYPYLMPTNSLWLKQSLFYWDHIQSILPDNAKEHSQFLTPDLQFLEAEGIFSTIDPGYITYLLDPDAIVDDVRKVLKSSSFPLLKKGIFASLGVSYEASYSHYTPILKDKMTPFILGQLKNEGINIIYDDVEEYLVPTAEAGVFMAVLTKHIAEGKSPYTVPVTDTPIARDLLYCSPEHTNHLGINLILENIFPSPGNDVPLQDIIEFRIRRQDELKQFKDIMSNYFAEVSRIKDVTELTAITNNITKTIEKSTNDLLKAMGDAHMSVVRNSTELLLNLGVDVAAYTHDTSGIIMALKGGISLIKAHECYINLRKIKTMQKEAPFTYLLNTRSEFTI